MEKKWHEKRLLTKEIGNENKEVVDNTMVINISDKLTDCENLYECPYHKGHGRVSFVHFYLLMFSLNLFYLRNTQNTACMPFASLTSYLMLV